MKTIKDFFDKNKKAISAGMLIGLGVIINTVIENKFLGAMLFSFALLTIIKCELLLYTGKIGFALDKKYSFADYLAMLLFNFLGVFITFILGYSVRSGEVQQQFVNAAVNKFDRPMWELFVCGLLCGALMLVAVYCKKTVITVFCIMVFILSGYEHCIVDFVFWVLAPSVGNLVKLLAIVAGNSIGGIVMKELID